MTKAIDLITMERNRQIEMEKWTIKGDLRHTNHELAYAAMCYAYPPKHGTTERLNPPLWWPWLPDYWTPTPNDRIKELVKAGALIAAEIDRLLAERDGM